MSRKYEFTGETCEYAGHTLRRIMQLADRQQGGWIEKEENLSHEGTAWVGEEAKVFGNARVHGDALVRGSAVICHDARVFEDALVKDSVTVTGYAQVFGLARLRHRVHVFGRAHVYGNTVLRGDVKVAGESRISGADVRISGDVVVTGKARIHGTVSLRGEIEIAGEAVVADEGDVWSIVGLEFLMTYTLSDDCVQIGCKRHTVDDWWQISLSEHEPAEESGYPHVTQMFRRLFADRDPRLKAAGPVYREE